MKSKSNNLRLILAATTAGLPEQFQTTGCYPMSGNIIAETFQQAGLWFGPRPTLETMSTYRQILPYVLLRQNGKYVSYNRTPAGEESRLHGKVSFGLGGHVDLGDAHSYGEQIDLEGTLLNAIHRELAEEVPNLIVDSQSLRWLAVVADNDSEVGRVHIGLVAVMDVISETTGAEGDVGATQLRSLEELTEIRDRLEPWSALLVDMLNGK